jgi:hypothetical protein
MNSPIFPAITKVTYSYSPVSGKYDAQVDSLTNDFDQLITFTNLRKIELQQ